ncbi:MAG: histidine kinase [Bacteroidia bacterium]|nr:histidine kinase [Bacteroidia bacterium]
MNIICKENRNLVWFHNMLYRILIVYLSFTCISKLVLAQQYNFKNYSVESGLPYVQIFAMFQDSKGNLWSGGYGGASKFNGKSFKNYSPKNGLANHYVNAIIEDQFQLMTIGTIDGLSVIDKVKGKVSNYYEKDGLPSNNVTSFCLDPRIGLWAGTTKGLCIWDGKKVIRVSYFNGQNITCLAYSKKSGVIVGTSTGLYIQNKNTHEFTNILDSINVTCISLCQQHKKIYIGTTLGLHILDTETYIDQTLHVSNGLLDEAVTAVLCQNNGTVWIGSKSGLISFNQKEFSYYNIGFDNNSNHIRSLLFDYENNLWIGTHSGLYKYRGKGFSVYDKQNGLAGAFIFQIDRDANQNLWITTENNGVYKLANGFFKNYSVKQGLLGNHVSCILSFNDGTVWFGGEAGISVFKNESISPLHIGVDFKKTSPVNCFYRDSQGIIWVGAYNKVYALKPVNGSYVVKEYKIAEVEVEQDGNAVWSIIEDNKGNIWAGTYLAGLFKLENDRFVRKNISKPAITTALDMCKDEFGNIYAATLNGVLMFNTEKHSYKIITEKDGLSSELVYALSITKDGKYVWAGTNQGLNKIDVQKLQYNLVVISKYGKEDGFTGVESNTHGIFEDKDSCIWFGTVNGLIKYNPKEFIANDNPSKTSITNIKLGYEDTLLLNNAVLPYSSNKISFNFDGVCLTDPQKVLYTYKLEGYDKEWSPYTDENYAKYDNLPPGQYTFKVKSCNNEGLWNIEPTTFSFIIETPYYKTWWFIVLSSLSLLLVIVALFRFRIYQVKKKQKVEFEKQIEISKAELKALRAQMNPHFVFNSLNSIQHYILNSKEEEAAKYLNKFAKLIRLILNNSEKPTVTINEDMEAITLYLELEKMRFDNKFSYNIKINDSIDGDYDEIPPMLIQPYLENAILHGINPKEGRGHIDLLLTLVNQQFIKISIIDDGIGRKKSMALNSLQASGKHKSMGMKITHERVRIHNLMHQSELSVNITDLYNQQKEPMGTQVDIFIPYIK